MAQKSPRSREVEQGLRNAWSNLINHLIGEIVTFQKHHHVYRRIEYIIYDPERISIEYNCLPDSVVDDAHYTTKYPMSCVVFPTFDFYRKNSAVFARVKKSMVARGIYGKMLMTIFKLLAKCYRRLVLLPPCAASLRSIHTTSFCQNRRNFAQPQGGRVSVFVHFQRHPIMPSSAI